MDYKELINRLRYSRTCADDIAEAATAIETLLAERDAATAELNRLKAGNVGWISVVDDLPRPKDGFGHYNVVVMRSHYPTSDYDYCDSPYDEEFVTSACYDSTQKIWVLSNVEYINALISAEGAPLNGDFITHWMSLPEPPKEVN